MSLDTFSKRMCMLEVPGVNVILPLPTSDGLFDIYERRSLMDISCAQTTLIDNFFFWRVDDSIDSNNQQDGDASWSTVNDGDASTTMCNAQPVSTPVVNDGDITFSWIPENDIQDNNE